MLALKLLLVPLFLLLVSLAGRRWGAAVAGWLAGLPVVAGPILFVLALERGAGFAASAAAAASSAVAASVAFSVAYAWAALRASWPPSLVVALMAWGVVAWLLSAAAPSPWLGAAIALPTLLLAPRWFPPAPLIVSDRTLRWRELALRMAAGAALTLAVTHLAALLGAGWSGLLAVFPVLGIVLAVFSHRTQGAGFALTLLRAMVGGLYAFVAFCLTLSIALTHASVAASFTLATLLCIATQAATRRRHQQLNNASATDVLLRK